MRQERTTSRGIRRPNTSQTDSSGRTTSRRKHHSVRNAKSLSPKKTRHSRPSADVRPLARLKESRARVIAPWDKMTEPKGDFFATYEKPLVLEICCPTTASFTKLPMPSRPKKHGSLAAMTAHLNRLFFNAARNGNSEEVLRLLHHNVKINSRDKMGRTALHYVCGSTRMHGKRKNHGKNGGCGRESNMSPSTKHESHGQSSGQSKQVLRKLREVIRLLLARDIELTASDATGNTALHMAALKGNSELVTELAARTSETAYLLGAVDDTDRNPVNILAPNKLGETPMHAAARGGSPGCVRALLRIETERQGTKHNEGPGVLETTDDSSRTPLHLATWHGGEAVVVCMIEAGAKMSCQDEDGNTPLHYAGWNGRCENAKALLRCGASIGVRNSDDETPLDVGRSAQHRHPATGRLTVQALQHAELAWMRRQRGKTACALLLHDTQNGTTVIEATQVLADDRLSRAQKRHTVLQRVQAAAAPRVAELGAMCGVGRPVDPEGFGSGPSPVSFEPLDMPDFKELQALWQEKEQGRRDMLQGTQTKTKVFDFDDPSSAQCQEKERRRQRHIVRLKKVLVDKKEAARALKRFNVPDFKAQHERWHKSYKKGMKKLQHEAETVPFSFQDEESEYFAKMRDLKEQSVRRKGRTQDRDDEEFEEWKNHKDGYDVRPKASWKPIGLTKAAENRMGRYKKQWLCKDDSKDGKTQTWVPKHDFLPKALNVEAMRSRHEISSHVIPVEGTIGRRIIKWWTQWGQDGSPVFPGRVWGGKKLQKGKKGGTKPRAVSGSSAIPMLPPPTTIMPDEPDGDEEFGSKPQPPRPPPRGTIEQTSAKYGCTKKQSRMSMKLFDTYDADKSGFVDAKEFQNVLKALKMFENKDQTEKLFRVVDASGDKRIGWEEFMKFLSIRTHEVNSRQDVLAAFQALDPDLTGIVRADTLMTEVSRGAMLETQRKRFFEEMLPFMVDLKNDDGDRGDDDREAAMPRALSGPSAAVAAVAQNLAELAKTMDAAEQGKEPSKEPTAREKEEKQEMLQQKKKLLAIKKHHDFEHAQRKKETAMRNHISSKGLQYEQMLEVCMKQARKRLLAQATQPTEI